MQLLLETFCLLDGTLLNLHYHEERVLRMVGNRVPLARFVEAIRQHPNFATAQRGKWRVSVTYGIEGIEDVRFVAYQLPSLVGMRPVVIEENFYACKWADRSRFEEIKTGLPRGVEPIFILNGLLTDTSFTNLLLEEGGELFTPRSYLLRGTKRSKLLREAVVRERDICLEDIPRYERLHLINAMLDPGQLVFHTGSIQL